MLRLLLFPVPRFRSRSVLHPEDRCSAVLGSTAYSAELSSDGSDSRTFSLVLVTLPQSPKRSANLRFGIWFVIVYALVYLSTQNVSSLKAFADNEA